MTAVIRPLSVADRSAWNALWSGYLVFYETELTAEMTELTWKRLLDSNFGIHGLVAEVAGLPVGFAHYSYALSTWNVEPDLYLEDLFVSPEMRGQGIARELIGAVAEIAKAGGSRKVFWQTQSKNVRARALYDKVAQLSEYVLYDLPVQ